MDIEDIFAAAGCQGWLCASTVDGSAEVTLDADVPVVAASVFKVLVALEFFRQVEAGRLTPTTRVHLPAGAGTPGPTGFSLFADDVEVSLRDLALMMLAVSDNVATDVLLDRVGLDAVNATAADLGLTGSVIVGSLRDLLASVGQDLGFAGWQELQDAANDPRATPEYVAGLRRRLVTVSALDPPRTTRTTARDMATLLRLIWRDEAGPAAACARVRQAMAAQVTRRMAAGFRTEVKVAAKSGGLLGVVRNEIGVVEYPDGGRYAVAVCTRAAEPFQRENEINAVIGAAAALAVDQLRG
jgi:beta-lactamase class A